MLVSYWYFERDKNKTLNFHMNNSFYRNECLALKCCPQISTTPFNSEIKYALERLYEIW